MNTRQTLLALAFSLTVSGLARAQTGPGPRPHHSALDDADTVVFELRRNFRVPIVSGTEEERISQRDHDLFVAAFEELVETGGARPRKVDAHPDHMADSFVAPSATEYGMVGSVHVNVLSKDDGRTISGGLSHVSTVHLYLYSKGRQSVQQGFWGPYYETDFDRDEDNAPIEAVWFADAHPADALRWMKGLRDGSLMLDPVSSPTTWAPTSARPTEDAPGQSVAYGPFGLPLS